jgi:hypothetical protein
MAHKGEIMSGLRRIWERWLDLLYGKEKCQYGKRRGAHEWFYLNCDGCREDWLREVKEDASNRARELAAREREQRISEWVEALRRFSAEGHPPRDQKRGI